jgi:CRP-like cAMP-binding protein
MAKKVKEVPFDPMVFLATVDGGRTISKYRKNETIFRQGDPAGAVFYIQKGKLKITVISEHGKEAVVALLGPDEFCGEGCLTGQPLRISTATAMTDCEIMRLEKAAIIRVLHEEPTFSEMFLSHLLTRTMRVEEDLVDQLFNSSEKRLARALLLLANFGKESRPEPVIAKVSQETLAELIGTTRSRRRADIDDRPATMPLHDRHNKVRHQIDRLDVDGKNAIELSLGHFEERFVAVRPAGVVDHDIEAAKCRHGLAHRALDIGQLGHIRSESHSGRSALLRDLFCTFAVEIKDGDSGAFLA